MARPQGWRRVANENLQSLAARTFDRDGGEADVLAVTYASVAVASRAARRLRNCETWLSHETAFKEFLFVP